MSLYKRPDSNVWQYRFTIDGKEYRGSTKETNKALATEFEVKRRQEAKEDQKLARAGVARKTLFEVAQAWLDDTRVSLRDHANNTHRVRKLFGDALKKEGNEWVLKEGDRAGLPKTLMVHEVTSEVLLKLKRDRVEEGLSSGTINREMSLIQSLLGFSAALKVVQPAVQIKWRMGRNKAASIKLPEKAGKLRWLTMAEEGKLLALMQKRILGSQDRVMQDAYDLAVVLLDTGARYSEIAEMRWAQVDLAEGKINLYRSKTTNESWLVLPTRSRLILKKRREDTAGRQYVFPAMAPGGRMKLWSREDKPRGHATAAIQSCIDDAGLNRDLSMGKVTPHTFRDTYASRLVQAGVSLLKVSHLLGHADESMTKKYAHLCPDATGVEAAQVLNAIHAIKVVQGDNLIRQEVEQGKKEAVAETPR